MCEALDYLCRATAAAGVFCPWPMPVPPGDQWILAAADVEPDIPMVRAELVTIEGGEDEEEAGSFDDYMAERGIAPLTVDVAM